MTQTPDWVEEWGGTRSPHPGQVRPLHELDPYREETRVQIEQLIDAQTVIKRERDLFAELYDTAPVGLVTLDIHGIIQVLNRTAIGLFGRERQQIVGFPFVRFIAEMDRRRWLDLIKPTTDRRLYRSTITLQLDRRAITVGLSLAGIQQGPEGGYCLAMVFHGHQDAQSPNAGEDHHADQESHANAVATILAAATDGPVAHTFGLNDVERQAVLTALKQYSGHRQEAANALGISLRTLQRKLKTWGLTKK